jgi:hypothetical protein
VTSTANISDLMGDKDRQILSTVNSEPDKKITNGLLLELLNLIVGKNDTGTPGDPIWFQVTTGNGVNAQTTI